MPSVARCTPRTWLKRVIGESYFQPLNCHDCPIINNSYGDNDVDDDNRNDDDDDINDDGDVGMI